LRPLAKVLDVATTSARLVIASTAGQVSASLTCDETPSVAALSNELTDEGIEVITTSGTIWFLVHIRSPKGANDHVCPK